MELKEITEFVLGQVGIPQPSHGYPQGQQGAYPPQGNPWGYHQHSGCLGQQGPGDYHESSAMTVQPTAGGLTVGRLGGWTPDHRQVPADCPTGLQYLTQIDQLMIKQKLERTEVAFGFETCNEYEITDRMGQIIYYAVEDRSWFQKIGCGSVRPFNIKILDTTNNQVIRLSRPLRCSTCWFPCCLQKVTVQAPPGTTVGYVRQAWGCCGSKFKINNASDDTVLRIKRSGRQWDICGDIVFEVTDGRTRVGRISKKWAGIVQETLTDADNYGMSFPLDLDVKTKSVMLGAVFLIDFMFFENDEGGVKDALKSCWN